MCAYMERDTLNTHEADEAVRIHQISHQLPTGDTHCAPTYPLPEDCKEKS